MSNPRTSVAIMRDLVKYGTEIQEIRDATPGRFLRSADVPRYDHLKVNYERLLREYDAALEDEAEERRRDPRSLSVIRADAADVLAEMTTIEADHPVNRPARLVARWHELSGLTDLLTAEHDAATEREDRRTALARHAEGGAVMDRPNSDTRSTRPATDRDKVRQTVTRSLDGYVSSGHLPAYAAERVEKLMGAGTEREQRSATRWALAASDEHYARAFAKLAADPTRGHLMWTSEESAAYRFAEETRTALNLSGAGSMVPLMIDPAIMLTNTGSNNPLRQIARVVQTATDAWNGVTSAGATAEWKAEGTQAADGTPALDAAPIPVFMGDVDAIYSYEVGMDALNFLSELDVVIRDAADQLMATAYTTGAGSTQPTGIVTALAGTSSEVNTTGSETYDKSDPFVLQNGLAARYSANAAFMSHIAVGNAYRQMETTNGALQFPELRDNPPRLLGKPWHENSNMDGALNAAATASNFVLIYGDFKQFVIVDRIGATIEILPVFGANGRPTGQRQAFLTFRTGSDVVVPEAFRMLDVPTTA